MQAAAAPSTSSRRSRSHKSKKSKKKSKSTGSDSKAVARRLQKELMQLMMSGDKAATAFPVGDNLFEWVGTITGPPETVYEGLTYKLKLKFPADYPYSAPKITFTTPCWHPNVDMSGNICLDILKDKWSAAYSVSTILVSLRSLLGEPNNASPLNAVAANLWDNQEEYRTTMLQKYKEAGGVVDDREDKK